MRGFAKSVNDHINNFACDLIVHKFCLVARVCVFVAFERLIIYNFVDFLKRVLVCAFG